MVNSIKSHIIKLLKKQSGPVSAPILQKKLQEIGFNPNKTTVYRNIDTLLEDGQIREVFLPSQKSSYYEIAAHQHGHFTCQECDTVLCLPSEDIANSIQKKLNGSMQVSSFAIHGICQTCNQSS